MKNEPTNRAVDSVPQTPPELDSWSGFLASIPHKCPKCDGQGIVSKPPWVAGDVHQWSSTQTTFQCDVCHGEKIIWSNPNAEVIEVDGRED